MVVVESPPPVREVERGVGVTELESDSVLGAGPVYPSMMPRGVGVLGFGADRSVWCEV